MKIIRRSVFETNSSSTHALAITKSNENLNKPSLISLDYDGEYGWEYKILNDLDSKFTYLAILDGVLEVKKGELVNYLLKDEKTYTSKVVLGGGKLSKLEYEVIDYIDGKTLVKINLLTGRHHQIRVQFSYIGYPLYGDQLYGKQNNEQIRLYAYKLEFNHPVTKEKLEFKLLPKWKELEDETIIHRL